MDAIHVVVFVGARPNIPKVWTLSKALSSLQEHNAEHGVPLKWTIVHSGQHYHELMGEGFASRFGIEVSTNLGVGSGKSDAEQMSMLLQRIDEVLVKQPPECVIVLGDVNTSVAAALAASRRSIPVVHLEAGLRAGDWDPEEINRKVITACSRYHLAPSTLAKSNLLKEGIQEENIYLVGNTMAETFIRFAPQRMNSPILEQLGLEEREYVLFTAHKSHNLTKFEQTMDLLLAIAKEKGVVFPCHPHTSKLLHEYLSKTGSNLDNIQVIEPLSYEDLGKLMEKSWCTVTDSAGLQEECTVAQVPCLTIGTGTARPETVHTGSNHIIGYDVERCVELVRNPLVVSLCPDYWDDQVSERLFQALERILKQELSSGAKNLWLLRP